MLRHVQKDIARYPHVTIRASGLAGYWAGRCAGQAVPQSLGRRLSATPVTAPSENDEVPKASAGKPITLAEMLEARKKSNPDPKPSWNSNFHKEQR